MKTMPEMAGGEDCIIKWERRGYSMDAETDSPLGYVCHNI